MRKIESPKYHRPSNPGEVLRDMFLGEDGFGMTQAKPATLAATCAPSSVVTGTNAAL